VEIAQPPLAILDIGLDQIAALARAAMPGIALGELGLDEFVARALHDLIVEAALELLEQCGVAMNIAGFEKRRADREILMREAHTIGDGARRMANLQAQIPERIEHVFDHALAPWGLLVGQKKKQVDVRTWRERATPVATDRDNRQSLGLARIGHGKNHAGREIIQY